MPHMLPSEEGFSVAVSALGINNEDVVVVYDGKGIFSAARVWWYVYVVNCLETVFNNINGSCKRNDKKHASSRWQLISIHDVLLKYVNMRDINMFGQTSLLKIFHFSE